MKEYSKIFAFAEKSTVMNRILIKWLVAIFSLLNLVCISTHAGGMDPEYLRERNRLLGGIEENGQRYTLESFIEAIRKNNITKLEDALSILPKSFRTNYTLMKESHSLQDASLEFPRAILFGNTANLIISFNGDPKQKGYNSLEVIQYRDKTQEFEFREITFDESRGVKISEKNPNLCLTCHRLDPRPNWHNYPFWPGAIGAFRDNDLMDINESNDADVFLKNRAKLARYRVLEPPPPNDRSESSSYFRMTEGADKGRNNVFFEMINRLNGRRIARLIRKSPDYNYYKYAVIGALLSCPDFQTFIPESERYKHLWSIGQTKEATAKAMSRIPDVYRPHPIMESKQTFWGLDIYKQNYEYFSEGAYNVGKERYVEVSLLRYLLEGRGIPIEDWSITPDRKSFNFITGQENIYSITSEVWSSDPDIEKIYPIGYDYTAIYTGAPGHLCEQVRSKSRLKLTELHYLEALGNIHLSPHEKAVSSAKAPEDMKTCFQCHSDPASFAPNILFDHPKLLETTLHQRPALKSEILRRISHQAYGTKDQMPMMGAEITSEGFQRVKAYLDTLAPDIN